MTYSHGQEESMAFRRESVSGRRWCNRESDGSLEVVQGLCISIVWQIFLSSETLKIMESVTGGKYQRGMRNTYSPWRMDWILFTLFLNLRYLHRSVFGGDEKEKKEQISLDVSIHTPSYPGPMANVAIFGSTLGDMQTWKRYYPKVPEIKYRYKNKGSRYQYTILSFKKVTSKR